VAVLQSPAWAAAAVSLLLASLQALQQAFLVNKGPWQNKYASFPLKAADDAPLGCKNIATPHDVS